jgi:hypothetical protein
MNSPHQPRHLGGGHPQAPVLFRLPKLDPLRPQVRSAIVEIPIDRLADRPSSAPAAGPSVTAENSPEKKPNAWPFASKLSAAVLGSAALFWLGWVIAQNSGSEGDRAAPSVVVSVPNGEHPAAVADPGMIEEMPENGGGAGSLARSDLRVTEGTAPAGEAFWGDKVAAKASEHGPVGKGEVSPAVNGWQGASGQITSGQRAAGTGWLTPASSRQEAAAVPDRFKASDTPHPPTFDPEQAVSVGLATPQNEGPVKSSTPNAVADWSRYLQSSEGQLRPVSATDASSQTPPQTESAVFVDGGATGPSPAPAETPFYE